jgi:autophagy-related protein 9
MPGSIYEELRGHAGNGDEDIEERAGLTIGDQNPGAHFLEDEEDDLLHEEARGRKPGTSTNTQKGFRQHLAKPSKRNASMKWLSRSPRLLEDDLDDDVPASLLVEDDEFGGPSQAAGQRRAQSGEATKAQRGATSNTEAHWAATQAQQKLHDDEHSTRAKPPQATKMNVGPMFTNPKERAMWHWVNVTNLDYFLAQVYEYYRGAGIWCICLNRFLNIL